MGCYSSAYHRTARALTSCRLLSWYKGISSYRCTQRVARSYRFSTDVY